VILSVLFGREKKRKKMERGVEKRRLLHPIVDNCLKPGEITKK